jgi:hypothetical protein
LKKSPKRFRGLIGIRDIPCSRLDQALATIPNALLNSTQPSRQCIGKRSRTIISRTFTISNNRVENQNISLSIPEKKKAKGDGDSSDFDHTGFKLPD